MLADVSQPLRDEERQAWQRLIRVIGHELNNSLAPIKSIAGSLESLLSARAAARRLARRHAARARRHRGRAPIRSSRFTTAYARLARLPAPQPRPVESCRAGAPRRRRRNAAAGCASTPAADVSIRADPDQLEQLLINLVRNAVDAALETGGGVDRRMEARATACFESWIDDEGPGLHEHGEPVRAVLHDQARRIGHRPRPEPADRRSARRHADAREPRRRARRARDAANTVVVLSGLGRGPDSTSA